MDALRPVIQRCCSAFCADIRSPILCVSKWRTNDLNDLDRGRCRGKMYRLLVVLTLLKMSRGVFPTNGGFLHDTNRERERNRVLFNHRTGSHEGIDVDIPYDQNEGDYPNGPHVTFPQFATTSSPYYFRRHLRLQQSDKTCT